MGVRPQPVGRPQRGDRPTGRKRNLLDRRGGTRTRPLHRHLDAVERHPLGAPVGGLR
ncbi:hypothetical protein AC249_AIPGENE3670, partial [Exaiptasia diaphana]